MSRAGILLATFAVFTCKPSGTTPDPDPPPPTRTPLLPGDAKYFAAFEAPDLPNDCAADADCHASGCGRQVCSAEAEVMTTCQMLPVALPEDATCGCLAGSCTWYSPSGATMRPSDAGVEEEPAAPELASTSCATLLCSPPTRCIEYYGIAGPNGPKFASCEIPCEEGTMRCPEGLRCITVADGPGQVCRASDTATVTPVVGTPEPGRLYDLVVSFFSPGDGTDTAAAERLQNVVEETPKLGHVRGQWGREGEHDECFTLNELASGERKVFVDRVNAAVAGSAKVEVRVHAECQHAPRTGRRGG